MFSFGIKPSLLLADGRLASNPGAISNSYVVFHRLSGLLEVISDDSPRVVYDRRVLPNGIAWQATLTCDTAECIRLEIIAKVERTKVELSIRVLSEGEDFCLASVRLEGIAAANAADPHARLALPAHGGRLINPQNASDGAVDHRYNWILDSLGACAIAYTRGLTALVRVHSMDDMLTSRVGGESGARYAQIGVLLRHRYTHHDVSYRRAKEGPSLLVDEEALYPIEPDFTLPDLAPRLTLELIESRELPDACGWVTGAAHLCATLPPKPCALYRDHMVYKVFLGSPCDGLQTTYAQTADIIRSVYERTGGAGQIVYLVGFQNDGHDDRYPHVFTLNENPGSEDSLVDLVRQARRLGATVSFHDNYDDVYRESLDFEADVVSRDNNGHLLRGGVWNNKQAYWTSLPYYTAHGTHERIYKTLARYPFLQSTYHLDVLTASVFRVDFRKGSPSGKQEDLQARLRLVRQFNECGLDVSSEACGLPFVGTISYFWHMQRMPRPLYEGDRRIPMVPFLVHGRADYGGTHTDHPTEILDGLLYGGFFSDDVTASTPIKRLTDAYFMLQVPLNALRDAQAVRYEERDGWKIVFYEDNSRIAVHFEALMCRVDIKGTRWIENGTAMIPQPDGSILLYVAWEEPYSPVVLPCSLRPGDTRLVTPVGVEMPPVTLTATCDGLPVSLRPGIAYRILL